MFKMIFKNYLILVLLVFLTACAGTKKVVTETKQKVKILTITNEVKLDTTVFIPKEKVSLFIPIEKSTIKKGEKPKIFTRKKGRSRVNVKIDSTGITATSNCDSIAKKLTFYKKEIRELRQELNDIKTSITEKKGYNLLELILYMLGSAIISFAAAYLLKTFKIL